MNRRVPTKSAVTNPSAKRVRRPTANAGLRRGAHVAHAEANRLRKLVEILPVPVWLLDQSGRVVLKNEAARTLWAGDVTDGIDRFQRYKGWHAADRRPLGRDEWPALRALQRGETVVGEEIEIETLAGERRTVSYTSAPLRDEAGTIVGALTVSEDVTEKKKTAARAQFEHRRLRKLVELLPVGVWMTDERGKIILGNEAGHRVWAGARYVGIEQYGEYKGWWLATGERIGAQDWPLARALRHGETRIGDEIEIEAFDGVRKFIQNSAAPIRGDDGRIIGALVVNRDITAEKRAERERGKLARLYASLSAINELVARASSAEELLQGACEIAVSSGDFQVAAVRLVDAATGVARLGGRAGPDSVPDPGRVLNVNDAAYRRCLVGRVYHGGTPVIAAEGELAVAVPQFVDLAESGSRAAGAFPLMRGEACIGVLVLRSRDAHAFGSGMAGLLERVAGNIAFGLERLEGDEAREAAEAALRESEARFRSLVALSSDWYWEQDEALRFVRLDGAVLERSGRAGQSYIGKRRWELDGVTPLSGSWDEHRALLEARKPFRDWEYSLVGDDGRVRYIEVSGEPVFVDGRFTGYRGLAADITPRKRAEAERAKTARMYASLSALNELVARAQSRRELLQGACEIAVESGDFEVAFVRLVDAASGQAALAGQAGAATPMAGKLLDLNPGAPHAESLVARAYHARSPIVLKDEALRAAIPLLPAGQSPRAGAGYPLHSAGACIGVLVLRSQDPEAFEGESGELLLRMARNVSQGLERIEAAEALHRFRTALDHSADIIALTDRETMQVVDVNDAFCRTLGYTRAEALGMTVDKVLPHSLAELARAYDELIANPGLEGSYTSEYLCKDGSRIPFEAKRRVMRSGERWLVVSTARDIRDRVAQERALRESNERFELAARATNDVVWDWNLVTDDIWWSEGYVRLFGYRPEDTRPDISSWYDFIHPGDKDRITTSIHAAIEGGGTAWSDDYRFRRADGTYADVFDRGFVARDAAGKAVRMIGAMIDITARKDAERGVRESEARFRSLLELSSDWYWEQDEDLRYTRFDARVAGLLGVDVSAVLGKRRWEIGMSAPVSGAWEEHRALLEARRPFRGSEHSFVNALGERQYVEVSGEPVFDAEGRFRGYRGVASDITARKRAELERARVARMYAGLSATNELVSRAQSAEELLKGACEIAVASGNFTFALVRLVDDEGRTLQTVTAAGRAHAAWLRRPLELAPGSPDEQSLPLRALRSGRPAVLAGAALVARPLFARLTQETGARAAGAFPLRRGGVCVGALLLNSTDPAAFDGEMSNLLERMAASVSQGLDALEAKEALQRFRLSLDHSADMIVLLDLSTLRFIDANDTMCRLLGYSREEVIGRRAEDLVTASVEELRGGYAELMATPSATGTYRGSYRCKDGSLLPFESTRRVIRSADRWLLVAISRDIRERLAAEEALRKSEEEFRNLAENAPDGILRFDHELRCVFVNPAIVKSAGKPVGAFLGRKLEDIDLGEEMRERLRVVMRRALETGEMQSGEFRYVGARGERDYHARFAPERGPDGRPASVLVISRDITDAKRAERAIAESEERLRSIVQASAEPLVLVDGQGTTLFANPAAATLFGRPQAELEGAPLGLPLIAGRAADVEIVLPDGATRPAEMQCNATRIDGRELLVVTLHDVSERREYERHIEHLANHDALTGLPNRTLLRDRVEQAIAHARRTQASVGLIFVDLDRFKLINDSFGHGVGDALLLEIGARLRATMRDGDTVARLGGDEFVIVLSDLAQPGDCALVARKIAAMLARPAEIHGRKLLVTASLGMSLFPGDGDDLDSLLQCADTAMYRAKDGGRNSYQFYSAEMGEQARSRLETEAGLRQAIERSELRLHYQPQVSLASGEILGFEALLRWEHPVLGMVSPASFVPVAEESGLILDIGQWALQTACRDAAAWAAAGLGALRVAVNLSARQFWEGNVTEVVRRALEDTGLPPAQLELEITESVVARDLKQVTRSLEQLRRMGVSVAIDDFGTGYSSLAYLRSLPIQKLKIDKSFIDGVPADPEASALVAEIVRLAHVLSLDVVAEGVENAAQARVLREGGCEAMQGFVFSRALPPAECATLLRSGRRFVFGSEEGGPA